MLLSRVRITSLAAILFAGLTPAGAAKPEATPTPCRETFLNTEQKEVAVKDKYVGSRLRGPKHAVNIKFLGPRNPLQGRRIVGASYLGAVIFDDDSAIWLQRNVNTDGAITGASLDSPECRSDWDRSSGTTATLNPHLKLRLEHINGEYRLVDFGSSKISSWIVTRRRVDGFDISPPPLDAPGDMSIMLVTIEKDKSLTFSWYALRTS